MDDSSEIIVIQAPVAVVSKTIVEFNPKTQLHTKVLGRAIQAQERGIFLFQFYGFDWTILHRHRKGLGKSWREKLLIQLSSVLQTRVITLTITDTSPYVYQQVWDNGESVEHIDFRDDHFVKLESQIRKLSEASADDVLLNDFYKEQGVYFPYIEITSEPVEQNGTSSFIFKVSGEFDWCLSEQFKDMSSEDCMRSYPLERSDFEGFDYILTKFKNKMKNCLVTWSDKLLIRKRALIESVIEQLKNFGHIEHTRHRSPTNFVVHLLAGLIAYCHLPHKPSVAIDRFALSSSC